MIPQWVIEFLWLATFVGQAVTTKSPLLALLFGAVAAAQLIYMIVELRG